MILPRKKCMDILIRKMWNGSIKVVTGIRRCGKSFLLNELFRQHLIDSGVHEGHIISISLEKLSNIQYWDPIKLDEKIKSMIIDDGQYYLILDEIQFVDRFEYLLNEYVGMRNVDVYVSGSNSHLLSKDVITEFRGRGDEIRLHPLSFSEFYSAVGGDRGIALNQYMIYGGMPKLLSMTDEKDKKEYLSRLFEEVYLKDIVERNGLKGEANLGSVTDMLLSSIGSLTNSKKMTDTIRNELSARISRESVVDYIGYLEDSFLFEECRRFDVRDRRYIGAQYKYYVEDVGLRNSRLNFRQQEYTHILENIVYNELRSRRYNVDIGVLSRRVNVDGVSTVQNSEIDFVVNSGERRYYIQVAYSISDSQKREQEISPLMQVKDAFKKILLTGDNIPMSVDEMGAITINIYDFLLNDDILERC